MADNTGAAFGVFPQMRPRRARQDREAAANAPLSALRGWAAGTAGLPGDIEGLLRMLTPGVSNEPALPTSDFYKEWLPGRSLNETPTGRAFTEAGSLTGGAGVGPLSRLAAGGARVAGRQGAELLMRAAERGSPLTAGFAPMNVIKPKGGNWLAGSVEGSLEGLKRHVPSDEALARAAAVTPVSANELGVAARKDAALNNWIDKQLARYVQKDMATPEDPIRALAEQGVLHYRPEMVPIDPPPIKVREARYGAGFPQEGLGESQLAKQWEVLADEFIAPNQARDFLNTRNGETGIRTVDRNPWLAEVPPETPVYDPYYSARPRNLGFDHLIDELRNAVNPESGLPRELLLKYSSLPQVSVPQAVQRVADINAWREAQSALARKSAAEGIPVRKEYPEGYRWLSVPDVAADEKALKYAVDVGCEGGWCTQSPETAKHYGGGEGGRLHLLVDKEGNPRVQIHEQPESMNSAIVQMDPEYQAFAKSLAGKDNYEKELLLREYVKENPPPARITQIKGKQNRAPNPEYLPYVQDFVKSGQWSDVGDLQNTGLRDISGWRGQVLDYGADPTKAEAFFSRLPNRYASQSELDELMGPLGGDYTFSSLARYINNPPPAPGMALPPEPGFATGGLVQKFGKGGVVKAALEEARDTVLKLKQLRDSGQLDWQSIAQDIPTRFYRGMANMVRGDEASPKFLEDLTEKYLGSQEPLPGVTSLAGQLRPAAALSDVQNMRKNMAWAASNPLTAATYAESPNSVMIPLDLVRKPEAIFDAKGAPWQRFFSQTGRLTQSGKLPLDSRFRDALRDPEVKSILVKNIYDKGIGSANELSSLYGLDIFPEDFVSTNLLIKDPSAVRYAISGETPLLKEPKLKKAEGGLVQHSYDPAKIDALAQQLQEELHA